MKKYAPYAIILVVGFTLGWLLFGNINSTSNKHNHSTKAKVNQKWTCSMHPQILKNEAGDCPICGMDLIPMKAEVDGLRPNEFKLTKNAIALANIQTSIVGSESMKNSTIKLSGKISENENENIVQASYFSGRIEHLSISSVGEEVKKGQLLATIYSPELFYAQQELLTASYAKKSNPELYKAVKNKLRLWKISDSQINEIEESKKIKRNFPIYATVSGTVSKKLIEEGDYVKKGQALLNITNLNTVWALFDIYENQLELVKKGQNITITTNAYPNKEFKKRIDFINPTLNQATRTIKARVVLNNKKRIFKTGMFVEGYIKNRNSNKKNIVTIPSSAILWTGKRSITYLKTNSKTPIFKMQKITLGKQLGDYYEVIDGLKKGDEIVTNGTFSVDASAQLQGKKSMMNKGNDHAMQGKHKNHKKSNQQLKIDFNAIVEKAFQPVIETYLDIKDALIKSDISLVSAKSKILRKELENIPQSQRKESHNYWGILYKASQEIINSNNIKQQRKQFQIISNKIIEMVKHFDKLNYKLFIQFCPMFNDNQGGFWLSKEKHILNPYFGEKMLKCGTVKGVVE